MSQPGVLSATPVRRIAAALRASLRERYDAGALRADLMAGIVVGVVALPLSMALAIASSSRTSSASRSCGCPSIIWNASAPCCGRSPRCGWRTSPSGSSPWRCSRCGLGSTAAFRLRSWP